MHFEFSGLLKLRIDWKNSHWISRIVSRLSKPQTDHKYKNCIHLILATSNCSKSIFSNVPYPNKSKMRNLLFSILIRNLSLDLFRIVEVSNWSRKFSLRIFRIVEALNWSNSYGFVLIVRTSNWTKNIQVEFSSFCEASNYWKI